MLRFDYHQGGVNFLLKDQEEVVFRWKKDSSDFCLYHLESTNFPSSSIRGTFYSAHQPGPDCNFMITVEGAYHEHEVYFGSFSMVKTLENPSQPSLEFTWGCRIPTHNKRVEIKGSDSEPSFYLHGDREGKDVLVSREVYQHLEILRESIFFESLLPTERTQALFRAPSTSQTRRSTLDCIWMDILTKTHPRDPRLSTLHVKLLPFPSTEAM